MEPGEPSLSPGTAGKTAGALCLRAARPPGRPALPGSPQAGPCRTSPLSRISQPPVASGEEPLSSPHLHPPEMTTKTKAVMRPPQGGRKSRAGKLQALFSSKKNSLGLPWRLSGKKLPAHAGDTHLIPGPGGFHVTQSR